VAINRRALAANNQRSINSHDGICSLMFQRASCDVVTVCSLVLTKALKQSFNMRNYYTFSQNHQFALHDELLPRDAMLARYMLSSCVCPSVTRRYFIKTAKRRTTQTRPYDSLQRLVFWC